MRRISLILAAVLAPVCASNAREGTPFYYQNFGQGQQFTVRQNPAGPQGQPIIVGNQPGRSVVGQNVTSEVFTVPRAGSGGGIGVPGGDHFTPFGVAFPPPNDWTVYGIAGRRFADFSFKTGVNSILKWDDMVFNDLGIGLRRDFSVGEYDMFLFGEYTRGSYVSGALSYDYDLKPYDERFPQYGLFTISVGEQTGTTNRIKFGLGARHIWDVLGWKISPVVGYEILRHDLRMFNHMYPNPATYIPLLTELGDYVVGDIYGNYFSLGMGLPIPDGLYQVCVGPEDVLMVQVGSNGAPLVDGSGNLIMTSWELIMGDLPWGVPGGSCIIIGGDGPIMIPGTTHIYNTSWAGIYLGIELEKQMTFNDKLRFYGQVSAPRYSAEGIWPNRHDWQQNPSFIDEGSNGAFSYRFEMEYTYNLNENLQISIKADHEHFRVGNISGRLFVSEYTAYVIDQDGQYVLVQLPDGNWIPKIETIPAHEQFIQDSLKWAKWQSFGLNLGLKYLF
ncbi:MAG: hypothetical protein FWD33_03580 [Alphaproteobacteria bacterium]|nr:hypothetical protein [Alphaproteobacteria bacterium]